MKYVVLFLLFLFVSCGKKHESNSSKIVRILPTEVQSVLDKQEFECASVNGEACPVGIGRVFIVNEEDPDYSSLCTGFLVASNKMLTNHHCLSTQDECQHTYMSVYNGAQYEVFRCKNILASEVDGDSPFTKARDFTVMELDAFSSITPFQVSSNSSNVGEDLNAWVIDHINLTQSRITQLECHFGFMGASMQLEHCPAISGNSGSPVLDQNKKVVGILWGSTAFGLDEDTDLDIRRESDGTGYVTDVLHFRGSL